MTSTTPSHDGKLIELEGDRVGVRFERQLANTPERVWRAITDEEDLEHWFPARIEGNLSKGAELSFPFREGEAPTETGRVTEYDPPRLLAYTWGDEDLRFELEAADGGCLLRFTHALLRENSAKTAAGWEVCLANLEAALAGGEPGELPEAKWTELHDSYAAEFGVDPEIGHRALREHRAARESG
jgi:uncharacterized protein YndB with AHSA1/START domain